MQLPATLVGKRGKCPKCSNGVTVTDESMTDYEESGISEPDPIAEALSDLEAPTIVPSNPNLKSCKDCRSMISRNATTCPHCGAPNPLGLEGILVVRRNKRKLFFLAKMNVWLNGSLLATLKNGETTRTKLPVGKHTLRIGLKTYSHGQLTKNEVQVNIESGETRVEFYAITGSDDLDYSISKTTYD